MGGVKRKSTISTPKSAKRQRLSVDQVPSREASETQSQTSTTNEESQPASIAETPEYEINTIILCQHTDNNYYEAKIIKGWNSRYDEALTAEDAQSRFLEYTEENRNYAKEMIAQSMAKSKKSGSRRRDDKSQKSGRRSVGGRQNVSGTVTPSLESETPSEALEEEASLDGSHATSVSKAKVASVRLTDEMGKILEKDAEFLTSSTKLVKVPAVKSMSEIFEEFKKDYMKKPSNTLTKNLLDARVDMIRATINDTLSSKLLYRFELLQYLNVLNKLRGDENMVEVSPKDYFAGYNAESDESGVESDISEDDSELPTNAIATHLRPGSSDKAEEPEKRKLRNKKENEKTPKNKNMKKKSSKTDLLKLDPSSYTPDFATQYGLVHFLRFCSNIPSYLKQETLAPSIYNYVVDSANDILDYIAPKISEYYDIQQDYENPAANYSRQLNSYIHL